MLIGPWIDGHLELAIGIQPVSVGHPNPEDVSANGTILGSEQKGGSGVGEQHVIDDPGIVKWIVVRVGGLKVNRH